MPAMTFEERLAAVGRKIEALQERARGCNGASSRLQQHLDDLKRDQDLARSAVRQAGVAAEDKLGLIDSRLEIVEQSVAAELADDRQAFTKAVRSMVDAWDNALERLQTKAACRFGSARVEAETEIAELRSKRNGVVASLEAAASPAVAWQEAKKRILVDADEVGRKIDELWKKLDGGKS